MHWTLWWNEKLEPQELICLPMTSLFICSFQTFKENNRFYQLNQLLMNRNEVKKMLATHTDQIQTQLSTKNWCVLPIAISSVELVSKRGPDWWGRELKLKKLQCWIAIKVASLHWWQIAVVELLLFYDHYFMKERKLLRTTETQFQCKLNFCLLILFVLAAGLWSKD